MMKRRRHRPEQAVRKLREGEKLLNAGEELGSVLRALEITESAWNRRRSTYGGMKAADVKRLNELEAESARLKELLAEAEPATASTPTAPSRSSSRSPPPEAHQRICAWTTAPSSSPARCGTGAAWRAPTPPTSSPERPGRGDCQEFCVSAVV